ncbi:MAG: plastocyanin/azurin family copper-binding protein [Solirubrobacteraceae bacterium]
MSKTRLVSTAALGLALTALIAGCGSSSKKTTSNEAATPAATSSSAASAPASTSTSSAAASSSSGAAEKLSVEADKEGALKYDTTSLAAKAGKVTITFTNTSPVGHNLTIESSGGQTVGATPTFQGGSKTLEATLKAGTYKFFCSVPGHRQAGMEGTITVK